LASVSGPFWIFTEKGRRVNLRNGLRFLLRGGTSDFQVVDEVFVHKIYREMMQELQPGDIVVDVGAQAGIFALAAAQKEATVYCYEPVHENYTLICQNREINGFVERVKLQQEAVWDSRGMMDLYTVEGDTGGATVFPFIHPQWYQDGCLMREVGKHQVPCVTLQDVIENLPRGPRAFMKMDCEGAEYAILTTAGRSDLQRFRLVMLEFHPNGSVLELQGVFGKAGFRVTVDEARSIMLARAE
jgi:FkbM family methyltransferase